MKRNAPSVKGPGWSMAFQEAANAEDRIHQRLNHLDREMNATLCDRSGDAGSTHIWPEGAQPGDWCLCGKRKRYPPVSEFGK